MDIELARVRARLIAAVRDFFQREDYLEVETPLLAPALIPERAIEVFATEYHNPFGRTQPLYLTPSPELWMKRLIARGWPSMFQICRAFRNSESVGREHNPEFTILEYYTVPGDYNDSFALTERLLASLTDLRDALLPTPDRSGYASVPARIPRLTVAEAFREFASIDLESRLSVAGLQEELRHRSMHFDDADDVEALFNRLFVHLVEPQLTSFPAVALFDYPNDIPTTARRKPGTPWAERWELYVGGVETANCYSEETDPVSVDRYFRDESRAKEQSLQPHPADEEYRGLFEPGFPPCSGVAMGVDRLIQVLTGRSSLQGVILFPLSSIL